MGRNAWNLNPKFVPKMQSKREKQGKGKKEDGTKVWTIPSWKDKWQLWCSLMQSVETELQ